MMRVPTRKVKKWIRDDDDDGPWKWARVTSGPFGDFLPELSTKKHSQRKLGASNFLTFQNESTDFGQLGGRIYISSHLSLINHEGFLSGLRSSGGGG